MVPAWAAGLTSSVLVLLSGLFSGLTLAWMSTDRDRLEILANGGTPAQRRAAEKVAPLRNTRGNQLLFSLLLANVLVNIGLASMLAEATTILMGFWISSLLILTFGELIPQLFVSRYALEFAASTVWLVKLLILLTYPITFPVSKLIDLLVGEEISHYMTKDELRELVTLHRGKTMEQNAAKIMSGALDMAGKTDVMTPMKDVYRLEINQTLDFNTLLNIFYSGFSRIPCYDATRKSDPTIGLLFVKDLILIDPKDDMPLNTLLNVYGRSVVHVFPDTPLSKMLELFKSGKSHLAIVHDVNNKGDGDPFYEEFGLITLEDIIEFILQDNIVDETDVYIDKREKKKVSGRNNPDVSALKGLTRRQLLNQLTPQELSAIFFNLRSNVKIFAKQEHDELSDHALRRMLRMGEVMHVNPERKRGDSGGLSELSVSRAAGQLMDVSKGGVYLYVKGRPTEYMTIILEGRVKITAGRDGFVSEAGKWAVFCPHVFNDLEWTAGAVESRATTIAELPVFKPDFSARVSSHSRILRISRQNYIEAIESSKKSEKLEIGDSKTDVKLEMSKDLRTETSITVMGAAPDPGNNADEKIIEV